MIFKMRNLLLGPYMFTGNEAATMAFSCVYCVLRFGPFPISFTQDADDACSLRNNWVGANEKARKLVGRVFMAFHLSN